MSGFFLLDVGPDVEHERTQVELQQQRTARPVWRSQVAVALGANPNSLLVRFEADSQTPSAIGVHEDDFLSPRRVSHQCTPRAITTPRNRSLPQAWLPPAHSPHFPGQENTLSPCRAADSRTALWYFGSAYRLKPTLPLWPAGR